ncbi:MAG: hypothetical protein JWO82_866 [Akkermansiaceae bacterium]|nr:hypothetical protein [Akkermansiaceae bacterium]
MEVNPYQTPAAPAAAEAFRLMPGASLLRPMASGLFVVAMVMLGIGQLPNPQPVVRSVSPILVVIIISGLTPWLSQRKKREEMRISPPQFPGVELLCGGLGRIKARGWLVKEVMVFVTTQAVVLREKLEDSHHDIVLPLGQIVTVEKRGFGLRVTLQDGRAQRIMVSHSKKWLQEIEAARQGAE